MTAADERPRRGPLRLDERAIARFLGRERWGSMCSEDESGQLRAVPVWLAGGGSETIRLASADPPGTDLVAGRGGEVCLVADEFESYDGIQGVILRGRVRRAKVGEGEGADDRLFEMEVKTKIGFTFAGTLPPEVRRG